jgi:hypothetical protein
MTGTAWMPVDPVPIWPTRLPAEINAIVRPLAGVVPFALEHIEAGDLRDVRRRETPDRSDQELALEGFAALGVCDPDIACIVELSA